MFMTSPRQKYQAQQSLSSKNFSTVNIQQQYLNKYDYLHKNLSPKTRAYEVNFSSRTNDSLKSPTHQYRNQSNIQSQNFQFPKSAGTIQPLPYQKNYLNVNFKDSIQFSDPIRFQSFQRSCLNQQEKIQFLSAKQRACPDNQQNEEFFGYQKNSAENNQKYLMHSSHPLSNSIYLKSYNQNYESTQCHSPKVKLNQHFQESAEKYSQSNFLSSDSPGQQNLKQSNLIQQNQIPKQYFPNIRLNNQEMNEQIFTSQQFQEKCLKQTRQCSELGTQSSEKKKSRQLFVLEGILPQFNLDEQPRKQITSYINVNEKFSFEQLVTNRKPKTSFQNRNNRFKQKVIKNPPREEILIQEYDQQNQLLEKDIEGLENEIQAEIQKERRLLERLNSFMEKLQTLKEKQIETQTTRVKQISSSNLPSKPTLSFRDQEDQNYQRIIQNQSTSKKQLNDKMNSFQKSSYLQSSNPLLIRKMKSQEKENITISSSSKPKKLPSLKKDSILCKNLTNILPDINESVNQSFTEKVKKQQMSIDSFFSVFESKYVPKMNNLQKLRELEELFEDQLRKGFLSTKTSITLNVDVERKQKLKRLSQQIKQLRQMVSEQDQSSFEE